ncbi:type II secretion system F family protein [Catenovulum sp. 2E275]|uniref:type II secretion system F family protein n=1 Tax=Catenovulum sp. 2E275 TaxID=2980497 RepID=UPI0021D294DC|nr:type II secretion system F family protein [Catenovulum sp. 2E275]MCU4675061.1 type II secretion system F family protein [Catenovulum sp. 2E275]
MATFSYQGKSSGETVSGKIEAANEAAAADNLLKRNITPLQIRQLKADNSNKSNSINLSDLFIPRVKLDDLVIFSRQMYSLTKAGIPIIRAIGGLADTTSSVRLKQTLEQVNNDLEKGRSLSASMSAHQKVFSKLFVSMINVGESTGKLEEAFLLLAQYYEQEQATRKQIASAMRYPMFVILAIVVAIFLMNLFVIPTFAAMFNKFNAELPWTTQFLINSSNFFVNFWPFIIAAIIASIFMLKRYINSKAGRYKWDKLKLKLPVIGSIIERSTLSRFARSFSMMLQSGVPLTQSLNLVSESVDNAFMGDKILNMRKGVERGESLLRTAHASRLFTPLVMQMIAVGEETGQVDIMLNEVADFYEREVDFDLKSLTAKIEPILIAIVAVMVLILALGIFMPMWNMMGAIKGR